MKVHDESPPHEMRNPTATNGIAAAEVSPAMPASGVARAGILFVHGIGSQRRGETLSDWGSAILKWVRDWADTPFSLARVEFEEFDTTLTNRADGGTPAHTHIGFHRKGEPDHVVWVLAESFWADAFPAPNRFEFARWALTVIPLAISLHFVPKFRRLWALMQQVKSFETDISSWTSDRAMKFARDMQRALGSHWGGAPLGDKARWQVIRDTQAYVLVSVLHENSAERTRIHGKLSLRAFGLAIALLPVTVAGVLVQIILLATIVLSALPFRFFSSVASWIQDTLSASIGDSYVFVVSPLRASAIVSQVQQDLEWLEQRCDRIAIVAHSQGAAISYRAIKQSLDRQKRVSPKLELFITYGSGLGKLLDLEAAIQQSPKRGPLAVALQFSLIVGPTALVAMLLFGIIPLWVFFLGSLALFMVSMVVLLLWSDVTAARPTLLPVEWHDLYASKDAVANGPQDVSVDERSGLNTATERVDEPLQEFYDRQCEVTNLDSVFADHTSYWSSQDDFIPKVATRISEWSGLPPTTGTDRRWLGVSASRRRWRGSLRSACRLTARLSAGLAVVWTISATAVEFGKAVKQTLSAWKILDGNGNWPLPDWVPPWAGEILNSDVTLAAGAMVLATYVLLLLSLSAWHLWQRSELQRSFFYRLPYEREDLGFGFYTFIGSWLAVIALPCAICAEVAGPWPATLSQLWWWPAALGAVAILKTKDAWHPPGEWREWVEMLIDRGLELTLEFSSVDQREQFADQRDERYRILDEAENCFHGAFQKLKTSAGSSVELQEIRDRLEKTAAAWAQSLLNRARFLAEQFQSISAMEEKQVEERLVVSTSACNYVRAAMAAVRDADGAPQVVQETRADAELLAIDWAHLLSDRIAAITSAIESGNEPERRGGYHRETRQYVLLARMFLDRRWANSEAATAARACAARAARQYRGAARTMKTEIGRSC